MNVDDSGKMPLNKFGRQQAHVSGQDNEFNLELLDVFFNPVLMFKSTIFFRQVGIDRLNGDWNAVFLCIFDTPCIFFVGNT